MMDTKTYALDEAISLFVRPGDSVVMGTALESLIPFAAGYEIVRQRISNLTLVGPISDILFDMLIGAGCVSKVVAAWAGNVMMGSGYNFRRAVERGEPHPIEVEDHSNLSLQAGLKAGAHGLPFMPITSLLGTSILEENPNLKTFACPFTGEPLVGVSAINPDVAILHVQRADVDGNCHVWGNLGVTQEGALAAERVIIVTEQIVPPWVISSDPNRTLVPGFMVDAVVEARWGSHPSPCQGFANRDDDFFADYHAQSRTREGFIAWLDRYALSLDSHADYINLLRSENRLDKLRVSEHAYSVPADFGF